MSGIDSYTKLCSHFNGINGSFAIQDSGNTGHIITAVNGANTSTTQTKIGSSSVSFASASSQNLSIASHADFNVGTGDFTIEAWVYLNTIDVEHFIFEKRTSGTWTDHIYFRINDANHLNGDVSNGGAITSTGTISLNTWTHVAMVRSSGDVTFYINGSADGTGNRTGNASSSASALIGVQANSTSYFNGFMDEFRFSNSARYTGTFTPSTTAFTSDSNTKLLIHGESLDVATNKPLTFVGTAQLDTSVKWGGSASLKLDGDSDYVTVPDSADFAMGSGDFTIDMWLRMSSVDAWDMIYNYADGVGSTDTAFQIGFNSTPRLTARIYGGSTAYAVTDTTAFPTNEWVHIAFIRNGNNLNLYRNGGAVGGTVDVTGVTVNTVTPTNLEIGHDTTGAFGGYIAGYIDEPRISKGIARWTSDFSVPTEEYTGATSITVEPSSQATDLTLQASIVNVSVSTFPGSQSADLVLSAPDILIDSSVIQDPLAKDLTLQAPDIIVDSSVSSDSQATDLTLQDSIVEIGVPTNSQSDDLTLHDPSILFDYTVFPDAQELNLTIQTPSTIEQHIQITAPLNLKLSIQTPNEAFDFTVFPDSLGLSMDTPDLPEGIVDVFNMSLTLHTIIVTGVWETTPTQSNTWIKETDTSGIWVLENTNSAGWTAE